MPSSPRFEPPAYAAVPGETKMEDVRTLMRVVAITLLLLLSSTAYGAIFGWTDSEGTAHFTNRESGIPPRYRDKAKLIVHEPTDSQTPQQTGQTQPSPQSAARSEESPKGVAPPVVNAEQQNVRKAPGVNRRAGRYLRSQDPAEEE